MHVLCHLPSGPSRPVLPHNPHQPAQRGRCCGVEQGQTLSPQPWAWIWVTHPRRGLVACPGLTDTKMIRYLTKGQMASCPASLDSPASNSPPCGGSHHNDNHWMGCAVFYPPGCDSHTEHKVSLPSVGTLAFPSPLGQHTWAHIPETSATTPPRPPPHTEGPRKWWGPKTSSQRGMGSPTHLHHITLLTVTARLPPSCHLPGSCVAWK